MASEVNQPWARDNRFIKRLTCWGVALGVTLWPISYQLSFGASNETFHASWVGALSIVTFLGAAGVTIATAVGVGIVVTDEPPLEGQNH